MRRLKLESFRFSFVFFFLFLLLKLIICFVVEGYKKIMKISIYCKKYSEDDIKRKNCNIDL